MMDEKLIVAVDFDGTCVVHEYPEVGDDVPNAVRVLKWLVSEKVRLILWTMRSGKELQDAQDWFAKHGIPLFGVNQNPEQKSWTQSPKAYAHRYIDDAAVGCPLLSNPCGRDYVDWGKIQNLFL